MLKNLLKTRMLLMKIKAFLLAVALIFSSIGLISCKKEEKDREYNEQEVLSAAKDLIKKSELLNEIYYGYGIECDFNDMSNANGNYFPADILSCERFGITDVNDIKTLTRECFTEAQSNYMINNTLSPVKDGSGEIVHFARYYQEYNTLNLEEEKCIMVYSKYEPLLIDTVEYFYETVRVDDVEGEIIIVAINVSVTNSQGNVQNKTIKIELLEEKNGFRINSPTYARNTQIQE